MLLRQTQAERLAGPYLELVGRYPDAAAMAKADIEELRRWFRPLGLVKRADRLVQAANVLVDKHGGQVPDNLEDINALPGMGTYSSRAVLCLAFGARVPMVDESSGRLLRRVLGVTAHGPAYSDSKLLETVEKLLPLDSCREFNLGLLDIAAAYCHPKRPDCPHCPLLSVSKFGRRWLRRASGRPKGDANSQS